MKRHRNLIVLLVVLLLAMIVGCAADQIKQADEAYALAVTALADQVETYNAMKATQTPEVQAKWEKQVEPKILDVRKALAAWKAVRGGSAEDLARGDYDKALLSLVDLLADLGVIQVE